MNPFPPYPVTQTTRMRSERAREQLRAIQAHGYRTGLQRVGKDRWTAAALFDDHPMYVGVGTTKEAAVDDLYHQLRAKIRREQQKRPKEH